MSRAVIPTDDKTTRAATPAKPPHVAFAWLVAALAIALGFGMKLGFEAGWENGCRSADARLFSDAKAFNVHTRHCMQPHASSQKDQKDQENQKPVSRTGAISL